MTELQRFWLIALVAASAILFYLLQPILTPFLVAALLAYLGDPMADRLENRGLTRTAAVCVVFIGLTLIAALTLVLTVPLIGRQLDLLADKIPQWLHAVQTTVWPWLQRHMDLPQGSMPSVDFKKLLAEHWNTAGGLLSSLTSQLAGSGLAVIALVANLALIPVVTFYLLRDWDALMEHLRDILPRAIEPTAVALARECDEILGAFVRGQLLVMLALGVIYAVGLWIVGLELALILGLLAGLASIVPYMGFIIGITAAGITAWFQFMALPPLLGVAIVFAIGQLLEGMVLTPLLVGDRIGLHPVAVIFAIMAGGQLAGFAGVLLALPVAAVIMVFLRHAHRSYKQTRLYDRADEADDQPISQQPE